MCGNPDYTASVDLRACKTILLFGGSFDPPHIAHRQLPLLAMKAIGADAVAYIPAAVSPFKQGQPPTPAAHRLAMLRLMLQNEPAATILTDELDRFASTGQPSYTIDTLTALRDRLGQDVTLRLLIGADQLASFDRWRNWQQIIELAEPVIMVRPPATAESMLTQLPVGFDAGQWRHRMVNLPVIDVSATAIRQRIAQGLPITGLVEPAVETYIAEHQLYT